MTTLKQFKEQNNGRLFKRIVTKGPTIEDIDKMREELQKLADENNVTLSENEKVFSFEKTGNVWIKPVLPRELVGTLFFKSNATEFEGGRGELPKLDEIDETGFDKDYGWIAYRYELVNA